MKNTLLILSLVLISHFSFGQECGDTTNVTNAEVKLIQKKIYEFDKPIQQSRFLIQLSVQRHLEQMPEHSFTIPIRMKIDGVEVVVHKVFYNKFFLTKEKAMEKAKENGYCEFWIQEIKITR